MEISKYITKEFINVWQRIHLRLKNSWLVLTGSQYALLHVKKKVVHLSEEGEKLYVAEISFAGLTDEELIKAMKYFVSVEIDSMNALNEAKGYFEF